MNGRLKHERDLRHATITLRLKATTRMQFRPVVLRPPDLLVKAVFDGRRFGLQLCHVEDLVKARTEAGAWWSGPRRMWMLAAPDAPQAFKWLQTLYRDRLVDLADAPRMLAGAAAAPAMDYFAQVLDIQLFPIAKGDLRCGRWAVSFGYDPLCVNAMRSLGGLFHRHAAAWQVPAEPRQILARLRDLAGVEQEFVYVHEQPVILESLGSSQSQGSPIQLPAAPPLRGDVVTGEKPGAAFLSTELDRQQGLEFDRQALRALESCGVLRDYQVSGVAHLLKQSGACLGDDMGLGKSRQTVVAARMAAGAGRVLILCPASMRINWKREIHAIYPNVRVGLIGEDRLATLRGCKWVVGNYERLGGLVREPALTFEVMAIDEAHYLKEHNSGRTRNVFLLAARIPRRWVITGTPLLSREIELHTLLRITGHDLGLMTLSQFRKDYTGTSAKRALLAGALQGWMLRRSKSVLAELGTKQRQVRYLSPAEGLGAYREVLDDMSLTTMPKIVKLRRTLEALKTQFIVETVEGLSEGDKIIVFCEYMATVEALKAAFDGMGVGSVSLVGADPTSKRQKAIDCFQTDADVTVFIGTTPAAGVGITLTAANYVVFALPPWTPALMRQAEDRAYRLGQKRNVIVLVPLIPKTIDDGVWALQSRKRATEEEVVEAVTSTLPDVRPRSPTVLESNGNTRIVFSS